MVRKAIRPQKFLPFSENTWPRSTRRCNCLARSAYGSPSSSGPSWHSSPLVRSWHRSLQTQFVPSRATIDVVSCSAPMEIRKCTGDKRRQTCTTSRNVKCKLDVTYDSPTGASTSRSLHHMYDDGNAPRAGDALQVYVNRNEPTDVRKSVLTARGRAFMRVGAIVVFIIADFLAISWSIQKKKILPHPQHEILRRYSVRKECNVSRSQRHSHVWPALP